MRVVVDPDWSFERALEEAWATYRGSGREHGVQNRLRVLEKWANVVGRTRAVTGLEEALSPHPSIEEASRALGLSVYSINKLRRVFRTVPESTVAAIMSVRATDPSIFLSHNWADKEFARRLAADLRAAGARVWFDEAEIQLGDSLVKKIREGIDGVDFVAVLLSPRSVGSEWVTKEVDVAMNQEIEGRRVKVLPLLLDDCEMPGFMKGKLYADFRKPSEYGAAFSLLVKRLGLADRARFSWTELRLVAGLWSGKWEHRGQARSAQLSIVAAGGKPLARMIVTYTKGGAQTIVEQLLEPSLEDGKLSLKGVGYSFRERGSARGWHLDHFLLDVAPNQLAGQRTDSRGREATVLFTRY